MPNQRGVSPVGRDEKVVRTRHRRSAEGGQIGDVAVEVESSARGARAYTRGPRGYVM